MAEDVWKPRSFQAGEKSDENKIDKDLTAVALEYDPNDVAPKIVATGKGYTAQKILEKAKENDVPTYKDGKLADTLSKLEIGEAIPPELYEVVAEILLFVDGMEKVKEKIGE